MRHYVLMYQKALSKISLKTVWYPNSFKKRPTTVYILCFCCVFTHSCLFVLHGDRHTIFRKQKKHIFRQMFF